ncbi:hypothetical protein RFI_23378 [Reticulomyxa filosa]|uniref:Uncharacterized protein n=1 Tax=Reticulomyxa filosa TaxID=46433 RepID=X6MKK9_RETFI|nr:hypothetical protein RFI_23378 [Reticulomyxa filosa]|eukprot:ETO13987.1 hypothetical protein RFI_23378 [Reticulomyxa filosa]
MTMPTRAMVTPIPPINPFLKMMQTTTTKIIRIRSKSLLNRITMTRVLEATYSFFVVLDYIWDGTPLHLQTPITEENDTNVAQDFATPKDPRVKNNKEASGNNELLEYSITPGGPSDPLPNRDNQPNGNESTIKAVYEQRIKLMQGMLEAEKKKNKDLLQNLEDKNNNLDQMREEKNIKIHTLFEEVKKMKEESDKQKDAITARNEEIRSLHSKVDRQAKDLKELEQGKITAMVVLTQELDKMRALLKMYKQNDVIFNKARFLCCWPEQCKIAHMFYFFCYNAYLFDIFFPSSYYYVRCDLIHVYSMQGTIFRIMFCKDIAVIYCMCVFENVLHFVPSLFFFFFEFWECFFLLLRASMAASNNSK